MDYDSEEKRRRREHRRKVIADWKAEARALRDADPNKRMLLREAKREAMRRIEESARTEEDFKKVILIWNNVRIVANWRIEKNETGISFKLRKAEVTDDTKIIPPPFKHEWWKNLLRGQFLDVIFDCPHEIQELTSSRPGYLYTEELDETHKALLYYKAIRQWRSQRIAEDRRQTAENIRQVYNTMIENIGVKLYVHLSPRYHAGRPLTPRQYRFCAGYWDRESEVEKERLMRKVEMEKKRRREGG